jgi:dolichol-phosphate mannosyltransferase
MKALVVVPTYEERDNVGRLVPRILEQDEDLEVLVVDDASPDGTGEIVDKLAADEPRVHVIHRAAKLGLGTAYLDAFAWALARSDAELVIQMDADFSHDPAEIPRMIEAARRADLVVGSRYKDGIRLLNWPLWRLFLSVAANVYASLVTGVPVRDLTSGFKCFRRATLEGLPLDAIRSDGYAFQIETTVHAWRRGARVHEVPIVFTDRTDGRSKFSNQIVWEAAWIVWRLRLARPASGGPRGTA